MYCAVKSEANPLSISIARCQLAQRAWVEAERPKLKAFSQLTRADEVTSCCVGLIFFFFLPSFLRNSICIMASAGKQTRKALTQEQKIDVIKRFEIYQHLTADDTPEFLPPASSTADGGAGLGG